ncbi:DUF1877 family protein [Thiocystis violacea]|uniref:DUF1877 family protein n=1 Tax=Thiocystis violacea TaxID=13725 RepID=UPI001F5B4290|nr:DUF1877 family protein [Thiocystis violacea]MBK1718852.1 hypothetical protein [Thiocystis violacea]
MSMNLFFQSFPQDDIDAMKQDNGLIDEWVWSNPRCSTSTDVETAWDVLRTILDGAGFRAGEFIDDVLSNGCELISAEQVQEQAKELSNWTQEKVLEGLRNLDKDAEAYHLEVYIDDEEDLLGQFDKLRTFFSEAAEQELGALLYVA